MYAFFKEKKKLQNVLDMTLCFEISKWLIANSFVSKKRENWFLLKVIVMYRAATEHRFNVLVN